ncbi:hypothetical protein MGSAQ_001981 [marine sediment metagenome]|uniref:Uncharacterized protein n=1 Tax=marine sediment metagenome TaxID=412755 RepID=A0A1B6NST0_9ZZZZ
MSFVPRFVNTVQMNVANMSINTASNVLMLAVNVPSNVEKWLPDK